MKKILEIFKDSKDFKISLLDEKSFEIEILEDKEKKYSNFLQIANFIIKKLEAEGINACWSGSFVLNGSLNKNVRENINKFSILCKIS
jgi:hypothetical protein